MKTKANFIYVKVEPLNLVTKRLKIVTDFHRNNESCY